MITKLNLASKPFRNRTLPYVLALLLLSISVAGGVLAFSRLNELTSRTEIVINDVGQMKTDLDGLKEKSDRLRQELTPEQQRLLIAAHKLVANKAFGWSRLFADLEAVLPGSVSASRISVQKIFKDGDQVKAELEFSVLSRDYQSVMQMIDRMNNTGVFMAELRGQDRRKGETITYTEYTLFLIYAQRYIYAAPATAPEIEKDVVRRPGLLENITPEGGNTGGER